MKSFLILLVAACVLYFGRETETTFSIIPTPSKTLSENERTTPPIFDMSYQHGRVFSDALSVVGHDMLESQFVYIRLPLSVQTGDTLELTGTQLRYRCTTPFTLMRAFIVIKAHEKGASDQLTAVLHCWLMNEQQHFETLERRIDVVF